MAFDSDDDNRTVSDGILLLRLLHQLMQLLLMSKQLKAFTCSFSVFFTSLFDVQVIRRPTCRSLKLQIAQLGLMMLWKRLSMMFAARGARRIGPTGVTHAFFNGMVGSFKLTWPTSWMAFLMDAADKKDAAVGSFEMDALLSFESDLLTRGS